MTTLKTRFSEFPEFWAEVDKRSLPEFANPVARLTNQWYSWRIYEHFKNDLYVGEEEDFIGRIITFICYDCEHIRRRDDVYSVIFHRFVFQEEKWSISKQKNWKRGSITTNQATLEESRNLPLYSAEDLISNQFSPHIAQQLGNPPDPNTNPEGGKSRADWVKVMTSKGALWRHPETGELMVGGEIQNMSKEGYFTPLPETDKEGNQLKDEKTGELKWQKDKKGNIIQTWVDPMEIETTQDRAGVSRILNIFSTIEIDLTDYLPKYYDLFHRIYTPKGNYVWDEKLRRRRWIGGKEWEEYENEQQPAQPKVLEEEEFVDIDEVEYKYLVKNEPSKLLFPMAEREKYWAEKRMVVKIKPTYFLEKMWRFYKRLEKQLDGLEPGNTDYAQVEQRFRTVNNLIEAYELPIEMPPLGDPNEPPELDPEKWPESSYWAVINSVKGYQAFKEQIASSIKTYEWITSGGQKPPQFCFCLLGKPGVGKSLISGVMAAALRRPYVQINMGGQNSTSIIMGDHASYQGAKFGDIVKGIANNTYQGKKSKGAVILLDELEKVQDQSVLDNCGILFDVKLNKNFKDNFLESICDLSEVLFLCTANYEEAVPDFVNSRCKFVDIKLQSYRERQEIAIDTLKMEWKRNRMGSLGDPKITNHKGYDLNIVPHDYDEKNDLLWWCIDHQWGVRGMVQNIASLVTQLLEMEINGKLKGMDLNDWTNKSSDGKGEYEDRGEHFGEKTLKFKYANGETITLGKFLSKEEYKGKWISVITEVKDWKSPYQEYNPDWRPPDKEGQIIYRRKDYKKVNVEEVSKGDTARQTASFWIYFPETEIGSKKIERLRLSRVVAKELGLAQPQKYATHKPTIYIFELFIKEGFEYMRWVVDYRKERLLTPDEWTKLAP